MESSEYLPKFFTKHQKDISKTVDLQKVHARILSTSESDLEIAGQLINNGKLVAFPTETVYGLGADALNEIAVHQIFQAKNRPLTDPVIVHVTDSGQALSLVDIDSNIESLFLFLAEKFWPGPLTVIMKAKSVIPSCVTANTGFVGIRCPNNEIAQKLISFSKKPIAAPSANLFAHVSPTSSVHVFNDLYDKDISIIDGENSKFGIESTVIKLIALQSPDGQKEGNLRILILRNGSVSDQALGDQLKLSPKYKDVELIRIKKMKIQDINENAEAPGQLLKHYSPHCDTFLLEGLKNDGKKEEGAYEKSDLNLKQSVLIDFGGTFSFLKKDILDYCCLSNQADLVEAMNKLYDSLRWAENIPDVKHILITNVDVYFERKDVDKAIPEFLETVFDKTYRSSSGKKLGYDFTTKELMLIK